MMGALYIEMQALGLLGDWHKGSGWTSLLTEADVVSPGVALWIAKVDACIPRNCKACPSV